MNRLMEQKRLYLQPGITRDIVAREVLTNRTYITRALRAKGFSFTQFVNSFRVAYALKLMADERYRDASPADIAEMSGFSSVDTMSRCIKKCAGFSAGVLRERMAGG